MNNQPSQADFIYRFNDKYRRKFNDELFQRSHYDIIESLKDIILSCQRDDFFIIKVIGFDVIEDYTEIMNTLSNYEDNLYKGKKRKRDNIYQYINLKDSDIILLVVHYFIAVGGNSKNIDVYISVPRIVDKYYFKLSGNYYCANYQIVDGSTYNNSTSSNITKNGVTLRSNSKPIKVYRNYTDLETIGGESIRCLNYTVIAFGKAFSGLKYILGKFGYYGAMEFMGIDGCIYVSDTLNNNNIHDDVYTFQKHNVFISVPRYLFDREPIIQSMVYTIHRCVLKNTTADMLCTHEFWLRSLGLEFNYDTLEKGLDILNSMECSCDRAILNLIRLNIEDKKDIYHLLRWIMREFTALNLKDNLDVGTKRVRIAEYIAAMYGMKLLKGIYRISRIGASKTKIDTIEKSICIAPNFLITSLTNSSLIPYRDLVNDLDTITALKFSFKGIGGIGENSSKSIPLSFRQTDPSHLGRIDMDSSSKSDPGMGGIICPMAKLYDGYFSDYKEPNSWRENYSEIMQEYKKVTGLQEAMAFKEQVLGSKISSEDKLYINAATNTIDKLVDPFIFIDSTMVSEIPLEPSGTIVYGDITK